jgi:homoserine O-succinyltransferase
MPDAAFEATERQFLGLLEAGSGHDLLEVRRYTMDGIPRNDETAARIVADYLPYDTIRTTPLDLLVVTGSNPIEAHIQDEPYWGDLEELLSWGRTNTQSMLLSCFSAHAALEVFDQLERTSLDAKCTGVFPQRSHSHPLAEGLGPQVVLPHSRLNAVETDRIEAAGYQVALECETGGWTIATKDVGDGQGCRIVLVQGHPEYDPTSLLREYHRDARRYVFGERDAIPRLPLDCVAPDDWDQLQGLHERIVGGEREPALFESFPFGELGERAQWPWRDAAIRLYANWMAGVRSRPE